MISNTINVIRQPSDVIVIEWQKNNRADSFTALVIHLTYPDMQNLITEAVAENRAIPNPKQQLADVTLRLRNQYIDRQLNALTHRASQPEASNEERLDLLRQQQQLRQPRGLV